MKSKLNNNLNLLLLIVACLLFIIIVYKIYNLYKKEHFNTINDLVKSGKNYEQTRNKIFKNTENLVKNINPFDIDNTDSNEILNKYINKHLLDSKNSVVPKNEGKLNNESLKTIQLIQLNELKLILEKINRIESIEVDQKKK